MFIFDWSAYNLFFSATSTQSYLNKCYHSQQIEDAEEKSYKNCYPFIYYLEHGKLYFEQAKRSPLMIQPVLIFYGFVHLIKACILTVDPNYPETTLVLAHGVSTRKRKKLHYHFFEDEVKFQKNGLFPFMADKLFNVKHLEGDKSTMEALFKQIPELNHLFYQLEGKNTFTHVKQLGNNFYIPISILDAFHMTRERFINFFLSKAPIELAFLRSEDSFLVFEMKVDTGYNVPPFKYNLREQTFTLPLIKEMNVQFNEILTHYLLLYNLSMIARYETEWWSELVKTMPDKDFPFIQTFLDITLKKGPFLIYQFLIDKM